MYLTYPHYVELGGRASEEAFPALVLMAQRKLDYWTQNRIDEEQITPEIRVAMTLLINHFNADLLGDRDISSMSNLGVSVSFADAKTSEQKLQDIYTQVVEILPFELVTVCM